ncbi:hypothetical protein ACTXML_09030 [Glutamicibacter arilaitensis]|uniref:hypothetical protein n=1 Tax=Glutamicibacter arilaitensis TaxID=256701 RepID=UPI003FCEEB93
MRLEYTPPPQPDQIQRIIDAINMEHLWKLRKLEGKDLADHVQDLVEMEADKKYEEMVVLLERIIDVTHSLVQYDSREPQPYYAEKAASIYRKLGRRKDAIRVLRRWVEAWPPERPNVKPKGTEAIIARLSHLEAVQSGM